MMEVHHRVTERAYFGFQCGQPLLSGGGVTLTRSVSRGWGIGISAILNNSFIPVHYCNTSTVRLRNCEVVKFAVPELIEITIVSCPLRSIAELAA